MWALSILAASTSAQVVSDVDWAAFLGRADPVWAWSSSCTTGYTVLPDTIKDNNSGCPVTTCTSNATCLEESASQCDSCAACTSFGLCPEWRDGLTPQLFNNASAYIPNVQWTTYAKGGPALANHSSCTVANAPVNWEDGPFIGTRLRLDLGRTDVWDRRTNSSAGATGQVLFDKPRLPIGHLELATAGNITSVAARLRLYDATLAVSINTTAGTISLVALAYALDDVLLIQYNATGGEAAGGAGGRGGFNVTLVAEAGNATRPGLPSNYVDNPEPQCAPGGGAQAVCTQELVAGGNYATALAAAPLPMGGGPPLPAGTTATVLAVSIANDWPASTSPVTAAATVTNYTTLSAAAWQAVLADHAAFWAGWYPAHFASLPDTITEAFYWIQMYKLGSGVRLGGPSLDLMGPWFQPTRWPMQWCVRCSIALN
jgi:hypothetical protein